MLALCRQKESFAMSTVTVLLLVISLPVILPLVLWLVLRRRPKRKFAAFVCGMAFLVVLLELPIQLSRQWGFLGGFFSWPFDIAVTVVATVLGFLFALRYCAPYLLPPANDLALSNRVTLETAIRRILDSESFLSVLRTTLPVGKEDSQFGLDYIPYLLHSVDERRKRAARSARFFLLATTIAAVIFSGVVVYFGYILVNEASAGSAKSLAEIRDSTGSISSALQKVIPDMYANPDFKQNVLPSIERMMQTDAGKNNEEIRKKVVDAFARATATNNFAPMNIVLTDSQASVSSNGVQERVYASAFADAAKKMRDFTNSQSQVLLRLPDRVGELERLMPRIADELSKPENRTPELIKRLALGVIISTFFLALLRYIGGL